MTSGRRLRKFLFNILFLVFCIVVAYYLSNYMFVSIPIKGDSMEHTIHDKDMVITYKLGKYNVGDVVIFDTELSYNQEDKRLIKRIIGLPGDKIEIRYHEDGNYYVYRNDEMVMEEYTNKDNPMSNTMETVVVPEGKFFFLGDNRGASMDSRMGILGDLDSIIGRGVLRYQPNDKKFDLTVVKRASG